VSSQSATPLYTFATSAALALEATFDGGRLTSDGGLPWLAEAEESIGICRALAACVPAWRRAHIDHSIEALTRQRVFGIACGYEDQNDADTVPLGCAEMTCFGRTTSGVAGRMGRLRPAAGLKTSRTALFLADRQDLFRRSFIDLSRPQRNLLEQVDLLERVQHVPSETIGFVSDDRVKPIQGRIPQQCRKLSAALRLRAGFAFVNVYLDQRATTRRHILLDGLKLGLVGVSVLLLIV